MNVLITSTTFIPSVILCGHSQLDYLEKQGKLNYKFVIAHFINAQIVNWADIIIFLRSDSDIEAYVSKLAKKAGKHLVYILDDDNKPFTAHTTNLVPFCINRTDIELMKEGGKLANIAPTIIDLLGKEKPAEMNEESLIVRK